jgi:hypothetical protein
MVRDFPSIASLGWALILCRSFSDSHIRIEEGGWTRQTTVRELPASKEIAGVNMRLEPGVIRELHWHKEAEWAYVLSGEPAEPKEELKDWQLTLHRRGPRHGARH